MWAVGTAAAWRRGPWRAVGAVPRRGEAPERRPWLAWARVALTTDVVHLAHFLPSELSTLLPGPTRISILYLRSELREDSGVSLRVLVLLCFAELPAAGAGKGSHILIISALPLSLLLFTPPTRSGFRPFLLLSLISLLRSRTAGPLQDLKSATHTHTVLTLPNIYIYLSAWRQ